MGHMTTVPTTPMVPAPLTVQIRVWLADHPGEHRPATIAAALGIPTHTIAARLLYMADRGEVIRHRTSKTKSVYRWAPPNVTPPEHTGDTT